MLCKLRSGSRSHSCATGTPFFTETPTTDGNTRVMTVKYSLHDAYGQLEQCSLFRQMSGISARTTLAASCSKYTLRAATNTRQDHKHGSTKIRNISGRTSQERKRSNVCPAHNLPDACYPAGVPRPAFESSKHTQTRGRPRARQTTRTPNALLVKY